ncbi:blue light receptor, partial [Nowakowskiella sp. JEL0078]
TWDNPDEISYFVGLQVDLVDQPQAILNRMKDGTYAVNYKISLSQPSARNDTDLVLSTNHQDFDSTSLTSTDSIHAYITNFPDFLFIISLRGLILYSPATFCRAQLAYQESELLGHHLSEFVHMADLVPLMRELRNANLSPERILTLCRFKQKNGDYKYLEIAGHSHEGDSTRKTKFYVLTARAFDIPNIPMAEINILCETWCRVSPQGLFLYVNDKPCEIFSTPSALYGMSLLDVIKIEDRPTLVTALMSGSNSDFQCRFTLESGDVVRWVSVFASAEQTWRFVQIGSKILKTGLQNSGNVFDVMEIGRSTSI